ncbi:MFS transporter [Propionibacterium sp. oral taxon 192]|uniref:MFS transporter n=1 Tax=Propionibacterium sp. oral taxon 192 TaxID=671222 RepID=UPI0012ECB648|nr:MFS transporter [Propionibacterium sp. oral taxon 192]
MDGLRRMRRLTRHAAFRRMVGVRLATQSGDAVIQIGMASYVLLNPQSQADAAAVAAVIALVMMPMAVAGPFVGPILDRFARTSTVRVSDLTRSVLAVVLAILVGTGRTSGGWQVLLAVVLVIVLSLNRLQLAGLGAGMPHTVDDDEYLDAAAVMPMLGPVTMLVAGGSAAGLRLGAGRLGLPPGPSDVLVFGIAAGLFCTGVWILRGFTRTALGPTTRRVSSITSVFTGLRQAFAELVAARPALNGVLLVFASRAGYGLLMTMIVVLYRHHFPSDGVETSVLSMGVWFAATGAGFATSGLVAAPLSARTGLCRMMMIALGTAALAQIIAGATLVPVVMIVCGLVVGLCLQSIKIAADTLVQAHISDEARGRVTLMHDIINNCGYVTGAVIAALVLPPDGFSIPAGVGLGVWFALLAAWFWAVSRGTTEAYDVGTVNAH